MGHWVSKAILNTSHINYWCLSKWDCSQSNTPFYSWRFRDSGGTAFHPVFSSRKVQERHSLGDLNTLLIQDWWRAGDLPPNSVLLSSWLFILSKSHHLMLHKGRLSLELLLKSREMGGGGNYEFILKRGDLGPRHCSLNRGEETLLTLCGGLGECSILP